MYKAIEGETISIENHASLPVCIKDRAMKVSSLETMHVQEDSRGV